MPSVMKVHGMAGRREQRQGLSRGTQNDDRGRQADGVS